MTIRETLTLVCPSCGGRTDIPNDADRYMCDYCGNTHAFQLPTRGQTGRVRSEERAGKQPEKRRLLPRPSNVIIQKKDGRVELSWRWFSPKYFFLLFFVIAWDGFLCFWYSMAFTSGDAPWIMFVFPIAHLAVGVFLTYTVLTGLFNRTTIKLDHKHFRVHHDPFPWPGEVNMPVGDLEQLYCTRNVKRGQNSTSVTYQLNALLGDGREKKLISNLDSPDVAAFLEQQIESLLRIDDHPVVGELER